MKLDSLVTTPQGHAPVGPPRDQNWMREPECRFQNAIQGVYVPLPHFCVPGLPPPEVCAYDMVWNKEEQDKALIIGALMSGPSATDLDSVRKINGIDEQKLTPQSSCSDDCGWQPRLPKWEPSALLCHSRGLMNMEWSGWRLVDSSNAESHIVNLFQVLLLFYKIVLSIQYAYLVIDFPTPRLPPLPSANLNQ